MENMKLACSEVYCILEILGENYKNKLPAKFLDFINKNRNENYSLEINGNEYENLKISKDGLVLISFLNLKYWVDDEKEKQRLMEIYERNEQKKQNQINRYKQADWLKQPKNEINDEIKTNENIQIKNQDTEKENTKNENLEQIQGNSGKELIEIKKISIFDKIKSIIKKIFNKKKE